MVGAAVGGAVGGLVALIALGAVGMWAMKRRREQESGGRGEKYLEGQQLEERSRDLMEGGPSIPSAYGPIARITAGSSTSYHNLLYVPQQGPPEDPTPVAIEGGQLGSMKVGIIGKQTADISPAFGNVQVGI